MWRFRKMPRPNGLPAAVEANGVGAEPRLQQGCTAAYSLRYGIESSRPIEPCEIARQRAARGIG